MDSNTVVAGDFNTLLPPIDRSSREKINKEIIELNDNIQQMDLTEVYRVFHPKTAHSSQQLIHLSPKQIMS
jgi:hypothetical protein